MKAWPSYIVMLSSLIAAIGMFSPARGSVASREGFVQTRDGLKLFYQRFGEGNQFVVAPAGMYLAGEFHRLGKGRTVVLFDQRARGRSGPVTDSERLGIGYEVSDLEAVRRGLGLQRVSLIGWSYTGLVVAKYALEHRDHVERVIQVDPIPPRRLPYFEQYQQELARRRGPQNLARLEELIRLSRDSNEPVSFIRPYYETAHKALFYGPVVETGFRSDFYTRVNESPYNVWGLQVPSVIDSLGDWDLREELKRFDVPLLTVHGDYDCIPMESAREWAKSVQDGRLLVIPDAGHFPWLENPDLFFDGVVSFLDGSWPDEAEVIH